MASSSGTITVGVSLQDSLAASATRLNAFAVPINQAQTTTLANGTGANQVNKIYQASVTINAAPTSIDLTNTVCTDGTTGFSYVRGLVVMNPDTTNTHVLYFGNDGVGTNLFMGALNGTNTQYGIQPSTAYIDQKPLGTNGYTVDGTHKNLRFDPGANAITFNVIVVGS